MAVFPANQHAVAAAVGGEERKHLARVLERGVLAGRVGDDGCGGLAVPRHTVCKGKEVGAAAVILQLAARQERAQVAFEHLDAEHAVDRAVVKNEGHGVGDGGVCVAGERVGYDGPVAEIVGLDVVGGLKNRIEKAVRARFGVEQRGRPAGVGRNVQRLHDLRGSALDEKVGIARRGGRGRV